MTITSCSKQPLLAGAKFSALHRAELLPPSEPVEKGDKKPTKPSSDQPDDSTDASGRSWGVWSKLRYAGMGWLALSAAPLAGAQRTGSGLGLGGLALPPMPEPIGQGSALAVALRCHGAGEPPNFAYGVVDWTESRISCEDLPLRLSAKADSFALNKLFVYDEQQGKIGRYGLGGDQQLEEEGSLQLPFVFRRQDRPTLETLYLNETFALSLANPQTDVEANLITWNPSTMEILASNSTSGLYRNDPYRPLTLLGKARSFDGWVAFPMSYTSLGATKLEQAAMVLLLNPNNLTQPATIVRDSRCVGAKSSFVGPDGALYVTTTANDGWFLRSGEYFPGLPVKSSCLLRILPGQRRFDPNYLLDYNQLLNTSAISNVYPIAGNQTLVAALRNIDLNDDSVQLRQSEFARQARYQFVPVDLQGQVEQWDGLALSALISNATLQLGDMAALQIRNSSETNGTLTMALVEENGASAPLLTIDDSHEVADLGLLGAS